MTECCVSYIVAIVDIREHRKCKVSIYRIPKLDGYTVSVSVKFNRDFSSSNSSFIVIVSSNKGFNGCSELDGFSSIPLDVGYAWKRSEVAGS